MWGYKSPKWGYPNYNQLLTLRTRSHDDRCPEVSARAWLHTTVVDKFVRVLCLARNSNKGLRPPRIICRWSIVTMIPIRNC